MRYHDEATGVTVEEASMLGRAPEVFIDPGFGDPGLTLSGAQAVAVLTGLLRRMMEKDGPIATETFVREVWQAWQREKSR